MKCPSCNGDGGEYERVLWKGIGGGPYYEDEYCNGTGRVGLKSYLWWHIIIWWENQTNKRRRKRWLNKR